MIVAATLICDRKSYSQDYALRALIEDPLVDRIYLNIETNNEWLYEGTRHFMATSGKPCDIDYWNVRSSWLPKPAYDQDQKRLVPIVRARNMAIDYAMFWNADHLLFVDSDVVIESGSVQKLVDLKNNLAGGYVPGRGAHKDLHYVFGSRRGIQTDGNVITCDHGTCGFMLISREVFSQQRFRYGSDPEGMTFDILSEDPAYCIDWFVKTGERFKIDKRAVARHRDDPYHPLTHDQVANHSPEEVYTPNA